MRRPAKFQKRDRSVPKSSIGLPPKKVVNAFSRPTNNKFMSLFGKNPFAKPAGKSKTLIATPSKFEIRDAPKPKPARITTRASKKAPEPLPAVVVKDEKPVVAKEVPPKQPQIKPTRTLDPKPKKETGIRAKLKAVKSTRLTRSKSSASPPKISEKSKKIRQNFKMAILKAKVKSKVEKKKKEMQKKKEQKLKQKQLQEKKKQAKLEKKRKLKEKK